MLKDSASQHPRDLQAHERPPRQGLELQADPPSHHLDASILFLVLPIPALLLHCQGLPMPSGSRVYDAPETGERGNWTPPLTQSPRAKHRPGPVRGFRAAYERTGHFHLKNLTQRHLVQASPLTCHCDGLCLSFPMSENRSFSSF